MDDCKIVDLYWARDERAISESDTKYGRMLGSIAFSLLSSREDAEECVNDTYLDAWETMPPSRPSYLGAFLSKIIRRISIDRYRHTHREKRGGIENLTSELTECIPSGSSVDDEYEQKRLSEALNRFLYSHEQEKRVIFIRRYFYSQSVAEISLALKISPSKVKTTLFRMRQSLQEMLSEEELL